MICNFPTLGQMSFSKPSTGITRGLTITLNGHRDELLQSSYLTDFKGFRVFVSDAGDLPLLNQRGFSVPVGHHSLVALTPTVYDTNPNLKGVSPEDRKCLFPSENSAMTVFAQYSQTNCFLECALKEVHKMFLRNYTEPCVLWSLPQMESSDVICNVVTAKKFRSFFDNINVQELCPGCLPDCSTIRYNFYLTSEKIRPCDEKNFGVSPFCKYDDFDNQTYPSHWMDQAVRQLGLERFKAKLELLAQRNYGSPYSWKQTKYDAFTDDIAVLSFFFQSQRCVKIMKQASQTWISYFAMVGGLIGLMIGVNAMTVFELNWWTFKGYIIFNQKRVHDYLLKSFFTPYVFKQLQRVSRDLVHSRVFPFIAGMGLCIVLLSSIGKRKTIGSLVYLIRVQLPHFLRVQDLPHYFIFLEQSI